MGIPRPMGIPGTAEPRGGQWAYRISRPRVGI
jgi:hypothetical protein